ncbi:unnamed protein product [marine sediment metagenome]|uniref:Uncharacterized protein n=1 Tax=marine sediment metagenome TaxID=412755 RepID=X0YPW2_9ZZZZ
MINKDRLERAIIERIKKHIITEKNLRELLSMINEEMVQDKKDLEIQLKGTEKTLESLKNKRERLFDIIESGKIEIEDIAPRLKDLNSQIVTLEKNYREALEKIQSPSKLDFSLNKLKMYVSDLKKLLNQGTIIEQKSFIQSFVKKIVVNQSEIKIEYTLPIISKIGRTSKNEVLPMDLTGSPGRIRTYNPPVNSRMLHR